jgi:hypothetical protein
VESARSQGQKRRAGHSHFGSASRNTPEEGRGSREGHPHSDQFALVGFRAAYVFDVSQTEGKALPGFSERVSRDSGWYRDRLVDFVIGHGIELEFKESIAPALGMSYGGKIALLPGQSKAEEFSIMRKTSTNKAKGKKNRPKTKLGIPDLEHSKAAVLRSLGSPEFEA